MKFIQQNNIGSILENILSLVLQSFVSLTAFECNTTSDWLNRIRFSQSEVVTFKLTNLGEKTKNVLKKFGEFIQIFH